MSGIETNAITGEQRVVELSPQELAEIESRPPDPVAPTTDPVEKLRAFLADNHDVAELLK